MQRHMRPLDVAVSTESTFFVGTTQLGPKMETFWIMTIEEYFWQSDITLLLKSKTVIEDHANLIFKGRQKMDVLSALYRQIAYIF